MESELTARQAFEAMRRFLEQFKEREPHDRKETIEQILRWTEIEADGGTADPAQWHDWVTVVRAVLDAEDRAEHLYERPTTEPPETVTIRTGDALAIRRLLWDVASRDDPPHDQRVDCYHWAAVLDTVAGMPPWPTPGEPTEKAIRFYQDVAAHLQETIAALRAGNQ